MMIIYFSLLLKSY